jgi:hypothetical protein
MNQKKSVNKFALASIASLMTALAPVAIAGPDTLTITSFTVGDADKTLSSTMDTTTHGVEAASFYNPTMGYNGWTHSSGWGYVTLKKGVPVTITATAADPKFHPGIAVWLASGKAPVDNGAADHNGIFIGSFKPWEDVIIDHLPVDIDSKKRSLKMTFITNAVDLDGWDDATKSDVAYNNDLFRRIPDGTAGVVSVTFTPPANGKYVFGVGGVNPNSDLPKGTPDMMYPDGASFVGVKVSVTQN